MHTKIISGHTPVILSVPHDGEMLFADIQNTRESLDWMRSGHDGRDYGTTTTLSK